MDFEDVFSSEEDQNSSSQGRHTVSTEPASLKTKNIKKKYEPITQGGKLYKYEENPDQYKRMRKKMQNRESATRVRGRKRNAFESLQQQVQYYKKENAQLQLHNAKLQTQNKSLKDQVQFMKTLIKPSPRKDPVEQYLSSQVLTHPSPPASAPIQQREPFFEQFDWMRTDSQYSNVGWMGLAIFTIALAVFVLPSEENSGSFGAWQVDSSEVMIAVPGKMMQLLGYILGYSKTVLKYGLVIGYAWLLFGKVRGYWRNRKVKKI